MTTLRGGSQDSDKALVPKSEVSDRVFPLALKLCPFKSPLGLLTGDFVLDVEWFERTIEREMIFGDDLVGLREAFGGQRVGAEVAFQSLDGKFAELIGRRFCMDDVFAVKLRPSIEEIHCAAR